MSAMHVIMWKFIIIAMTRMETENAKWNEDNIWKQTMGRLRTRLNAHAEGVRLLRIKQEAQDKTFDDFFEHFTQNLKL